MQTHYLVNDKPAPASVDAAKKRIAQLDNAIAKLEDLVRGPGDRATGNLGWLREEKKMLLAWLAAEEEKPFWGKEKDAPIPRIECSDYADFWKE